MNSKEIIEEKCRIIVNSIKPIGEGYDSKAYLVNNSYIFKIKHRVLMIIAVTHHLETVH